MSNVASLLASAAAKRKAPPAPEAQASRPALVWESIDPLTLPDDIRDAYLAIAKARSAFEARLTALLEPPAHLRLAFAYRRGLAIALAPRATAPDGLANLMSRLTAAE